MEKNVVERDSFNALRQGVGFLDLQRGVIRLTGADRLDLLSRLSTADIARLKGGESARTILTSEKGRVIDLLDLLVFEDHVLAVSSHSNPKETLAWIEKYTIMDDVLAEDLSAEMVVYGLYGDRVPALCRERFHVALPDGGSHIDATPLESETVVHLLRGDNLNGPFSLFLVSEQSSSEALHGLLYNAGATVLDLHTYELMRILAGRPGPGGELTLKQNPLELGLASDVSFTKGCYIGQEVIARLDSYDKVKNRLIGFHMDDASGGVEGGSLKVRSLPEKETVGHVTSLAELQGSGTYGLAIVRSTHASPGTAVEFVTEESGDVVGEGSLEMLPMAVNR